MNILLVGGTEFLGRYQTESALARGHAVTLFNRGKSNPELFPNVEKLRGDRNESLDALTGRRWDAVIDTCDTRRTLCVPQRNC
jgi:2'-hydroxyisoflavone reductase